VNRVGLQQGFHAVVFSFGLKMKAVYSSELFVLNVSLHSSENLKSDGLQIITFILTQQMLKLSDFIPGILFPFI
jgi:hypothetical protein